MKPTRVTHLDKGSRRMTCACKVNRLVDETREYSVLEQMWGLLINNEIVGRTSGRRRIAKLQASFYASHLLIGGLDASNSSRNFT